MGNGLTWWHRCAASYGIAGAALCRARSGCRSDRVWGEHSPASQAVSPRSSGPDASPATPTSAQTDPTDPKGLSRAAVALASKTGSSAGSKSGVRAPPPAPTGAPQAAAGTPGPAVLVEGRDPRRSAPPATPEARVELLGRRLLGRRLVRPFDDQCPRHQRARDGRRQRHGEQHRRQRQRHRQ